MSVILLLLLRALTFSFALKNLKSRIADRWEYSEAWTYDLLFCTLFCVWDKKKQKIPVLLIKSLAINPKLLWNNTIPACVHLLSCDPLSSPQVVYNVGLCICLYDITKLEDSYIFPGDGASHTKGLMMPVNRAVSFPHSYLAWSPVPHFLLPLKILDTLPRICFVVFNYLWWGLELTFY